MDDEREADSAHDTSAKRRAAHREPERDARYQLYSDARHRDRERGREADVRKLVANPAACEPKQLDVGDLAAEREGHPTVAHQLVADEADTARRERDSRQENSELSHMLVHRGCPGV